MAYNSFSFKKLKTNYGIDLLDADLFENLKIKNIEPSALLIELLSDTKRVPLNSEKAKSEVLIYPIIRELVRRNENISVFSGYAFNIKGQKDLSGAPDFLISARPQTIELNSPVFCLVESKNKSTNDGFAECAAEMYAARLYNQQNNDPFETIYGAVTDAYNWVFLKLEENNIFVDTKRYYLIELPKLLGILQFIIDQIKLVELK